MTTFELIRADLTRNLTVWSLGSLAAGAVVAGLARGPRAAGVARQCLAWGGIDLALASLGRRSQSRPVADVGAATASLRRLLLVNAALDVGYVAAGVALVRVGQVKGRDSVGDGAAVIVQGGFLLVLDTLTARRLGTTTV